MHRSAGGVDGWLAIIDSGGDVESGRKHATCNKGGPRRDVLADLFIANTDLDYVIKLNNLWRQGIAVNVLRRSRGASMVALRVIRDAGGELADDIDPYVALHAAYVHPASASFDRNMGGIPATPFWNPYPVFCDTNNLGWIVFFGFGSFNILVPGDLESDALVASLKQLAFRTGLIGTTYWLHRIRDERTAGVAARTYPANIRCSSAKHKTFGVFHAD